MIVAEPMPVHRTRVLARGNFRHGTDDVIPHFQAITEPARDADAVILQQLYYIGAHGDPDLSFAPHWSPSGHPSYHGSHRVTDPDIEVLIAAQIAATGQPRSLRPEPS